MVLYSPKQHNSQAAVHINQNINSLQHLYKTGYGAFLRPYGQHFLWDMNNTKCCIGFDFEFRPSFAKETFSYDEYLKSQNIQY